MGFIPLFSVKEGKVVGKEVDPLQLATEYSLVGEFAVDIVDTQNEINKDLITTIIKATSACRVVVHDTPAALFWLNTGATKVILDTSTPAAAVVETFTSLPKERLIVDLGNANLFEERIATLKEIASQFLLSFEGDLVSHIDTIKKVFTWVWGIRGDKMFKC
jgi:hypothetical protein